MWNSSLTEGRPGAALADRGSAPLESSGKGRGGYPLSIGPFAVLLPAAAGLKAQAVLSQRAVDPSRAVPLTKLETMMRQTMMRLQAIAACGRLAAACLLLLALGCDR